jgi:hypothetical protein
MRGSRDGPNGRMAVRDAEGVAIMLYPHVQWPVGALLMVAPFDPELHSANSVGRRGMCQWADHSDEAGKTNATWSAVWNGERWAVCDVHLAALARAELTRAADIEVPPNEPAVSPGSIAEQDAAQRNEVPLAERFQAHLLSDVGALQGRYDPHLYRQMIRQHGGVGEELSRPVDRRVTRLADHLLIRRVARRVCPSRRPCWLIRVSCGESEVESL